MTSFCLFSAYKEDGIPEFLCLSFPFSPSEIASSLHIGLHLVVVEIGYEILRTAIKSSSGACGSQFS